ncbi:RBM7 protein, partial [Pitta sordida]|nr:RBM7 protein [Pitta sordida]
QAGPVITVKIPKDRDGRPKQFAFVNFKHEESVPYGLQLLNGIKLYGRPMRIQFRSGSSHAAQDVSPSSCPLRSPGPLSPGTVSPGSNCSRYERVPDGAAAAGFPPSLQRQAVVGFGVPLTLTTLPLSLCPSQMNSAARQQPQFKYEQPGFSPPGYPHAFPYSPDSRHLGRERFVERGPDYGRGKRDEYGFEERGHEAEHHYRGGREEPYDGWSHDYDYRRESYREAKWHPAR